GGAIIPFTVAKDGDEIYFGFNMETKQLTISTEGAPKGSLAKQRAHWVNRDTIVWNVTGTPRFSYKLHYSPNAELQLGAKGVSGGETLDLSFTNAGPGEAALKQFPHLAGFSAFKIAPEDLAKIPAALQGQLAVSAFDAEGKLIDATALQIPGALDDLFSYDGPLGVSYDGSTPTLRLWAPTARSVRLLRFADSKAETQPTASTMQNDPTTGVWSISGAADWTGQFYLYEVEVYAPSTGKIETNRVTDPYSLSLATNSTRSQIVNLADPALAPQGWDAVKKPALATPTDIALYELHVRDFSITDSSVPEELRGTFKASAGTGPGRDDPHSPAAHLRHRHH
ncbi:MAG: DUF3372 domain-containing protein, partial [Chloroflexaceae bacterium]|nr:DUF3372 domain-containing protein [Chloroflexaceae bacterium]